MTSDESAEMNVRATVERLIERGSHFDVDALEDLYHARLRIVKIDENDAVTVIDRAENMRFFRGEQARGARPLATDATFNHVHVDGDRAHVLVTRRMALTGRPEKSVFSIHLQREDARWQVTHETAFVQPDDAPATN